MGPVSVFHIAFASIAIFACSLQLFISYKKNGELIFIVGALLSLVVFLSFSTKFLCSTSIGNLFSSLDILRCQLVLYQATTICMLGVIFHLMKNVKKLFMLLNISILIFFIIISLIVPDNILFGNNVSVRSQVLPYDDSLYLIDKAITLWRIMVDLTILVFSIAVMLFLIRRLNVLSKRTNIIILSGLGLILLSAINDQIIDINQIYSPYLLPYALFAFYIILLFIPFSIFVKEVISQQKLIQQEKRWRDMVNEINAIVVELDRMGHVKFTNQ